MGKGRIAVGYDADLVLVDLNADRVITNDWIESKCGWTPFNDTKVRGWPITTILRGKIAMQDDEILGEPLGAAVRFLKPPRGYFVVGDLVRNTKFHDWQEFEKLKRNIQELLYCCTVF